MKDSLWIRIIKWGLLLILIILSFSGLVYYIGYNSGQLDALKGKQSYNKMVVYKRVDSTYKAVDTLYIKK